MWENVLSTKKCAKYYSFYILIRHKIVWKCKKWWFLCISVFMERLGNKIFNQWNLKMKYNSLILLYLVQGGSSRKRRYPITYECTCIIIYSCWPKNIQIRKKCNGHTNICFFLSSNYQSSAATARFFPIMAIWANELTLHLENLFLSRSTC